MTEPTPTTEATWRNRFILMNLVRIGGTALVILGLVIWQSNWLREGGWTEVGFPMAIVGLLISFWMPIWLSRRWRAKG